MKSRSAEVVKRSRRGKEFWIGSGVAIVALVSFYYFVVAYENWSGAREWARVEKKLTSGGVELDPKALLFPVPRPEDNLGSHPMVTALFELRQDEAMANNKTKQSRLFYDLKLPENKQYDGFLPSWDERLPLRLVPLVKSEGGEGEENMKASFEHFIRPFEEALADLDEAATRPEAVIEFELADSFLEKLSATMPHLSLIMDHQRLQATRVCLALERGDQVEARAGIRTMLQLSRLAGSQPFLISHLVEITSQNVALSTIWHGLNERLWSEESLVWLNGEMRGQPRRQFASLARALNFELCVMTIGAMEFLKTPEGRKLNWDAMDSANVADTRSSWLMKWVPVGTLDHNAAFGAETIYDSSLGPALRGEVSTEEVNLSELRTTPRNFLALKVTPAATRISHRSCYSATGFEMARIAIALERFYSAEQRYPKSLDELVPRYLSVVPEDPYTDGVPLRYRPEAKRYVIYSVGYNRKDNGGMPGFLRPNKKSIDIKKGDWVWGYEPLPDPDDS